jgi:hypothetical protein
VRRDYELLLFLAGFGFEFFGDGAAQGGEDLVAFLFREFDEVKPEVFSNVLGGSFEVEFLLFGFWLLLGFVTLRFAFVLWQGWLLWGEGRGCAGRLAVAGDLVGRGNWPRSSNRKGAVGCAPGR